MTADLFGTPEPSKRPARTRPPAVREAGEPAAEPAGDEPRVWSVSDLTRAVRATLETGIGVVWVEGEVSNYRRQPSGHQYFTLKDAQSQVSCVWFARPGLRLKQVALSDGMHVQVRGALTVYEARGQYQLNVQLVQAGGAGLLQAKFEALKRKLEAEGLFDAERKRPLPKFPMRIGIVTSPTGAALRDVANILARRAPWARLIIQPVRVQGEGASREIAAAVAALNRLAESGLPPVDVILVTRGGGSTEDLWEFNEEVVARAIAASELPVVSAVGHEIDFTIADFVADLRAPTPSAAAELLVPDTSELLARLQRLRAQQQRALLSQLAGERRRLEFLSRNALFREPARRVSEAAQRLDVAGDALRWAAQARLDAARQRLKAFGASLRQHRPDQLLALRRVRFDAIRLQLNEHLRRGLIDRRAQLDRVRHVLGLLAPEALLARGYSMTTTAAGKVVTSIHDVTPRTRIVTKLRDGSIESIVE
jgi:exodeoxyribonuclease VII large subunit